MQSLNHALWLKQKQQFFPYLAVRFPVFHSHVLSVAGTHNHSLLSLLPLFFWGGGLALRRVALFAF